MKIAGRDDEQKIIFFGILNVSKHKEGERQIKSIEQEEVSSRGAIESI